MIAFQHLQGSTEGAETRNVQSFSWPWHFFQEPPSCFSICQHITGMPMLRRHLMMPLCCWWWCLNDRGVWFLINGYNLQVIMNNHFQGRCFCNMCFNNGVMWSEAVFDECIILLCCPVWKVNDYRSRIFMSHSGSRVFYAKTFLWPKMCGITDMHKKQNDHTKLTAAAKTLV